MNGSSQSGYYKIVYNAAYLSAASNYKTPAYVVFVPT